MFDDKFIMRLRSGKNEALNWFEKDWVESVSQIVSHFLQKRERISMLLLRLKK